MPRLITIFANFWAGVVSTFAAGFFGVWAGAESVSNLINYIIIAKKGGVKLSGEFAINTVFCFIAIILILYSIYASYVIYRSHKRSSPISHEIRDMRSRYDEVLALASGLTESIYPDPHDRRRVDIVKMRVHHEVKHNGDAKIKREYEIKCPSLPAHIFTFWIDLDDETPGIEGFRALKISVKDNTNNRNLYWIPTTDNLRRKKGTIFFSEMSPGDTKKIQLSYECKGYLNKLLNKDFCEFVWSHKCATPNATAEIVYEWTFDPGFPAISAELRGQHCTGATIVLSKPAKGMTWTYTAPNAEIDNRDYTVFMQLEKA